MSKEALNWYNNQKIQDRTLKAVLHSLAFLAGRGTCECLKSQQDIALRASLTDRAVRETLVILELLEMISRRPRNKGRYGRTTDAISLPIDRNFDISKEVVKAVRKLVRAPLPPEPRSTGAKSSYRNRVPLLPEPRSGEYNTVNTEDTLSGKDLALTVDVEDTRKAVSKSAAREDCLVIPFKRGGAA